jgi:hypothetical protein
VVCIFLLERNAGTTGLQAIQDFRLIVAQTGNNAHAGNDYTTHRVLLSIILMTAIYGFGFLFFNSMHTQLWRLFMY